MSYHPPPQTKKLHLKVFQHFLTFLVQLSNLVALAFMFCYVTLCIYACSVPLSNKSRTLYVSITLLHAHKKHKGIKAFTYRF